MGRIPFHRPVRAMPPTLEAQRIALPSLPQDQPGSTASMMPTLLPPLMSSVTTASYMVIYHNTLLIILGVTFVLFAIGTTVFARYQMKHSARQSKSSQRCSMRFLASVKSTARDVAAVQRLVAAWVHPSPERLWAIARRRRRVWERHNNDDDFLRVRLDLGRGELAGAIQLGSQGDPFAEYEEKDSSDNRICAEAHAVVRRFGTVGKQPALVELAKAGGVVSVLGPTGVARAVARSLVCQVSAPHAPDDVAVYNAGDESWNWAKWLPNSHEPDAIGTSGVVPMVSAEIDDLADGRQLPPGRGGLVRRNSSPSLIQVAEHDNDDESAVPFADSGMVI